MKTQSELLKVQIRLAHTYRYLRAQNLKKNLILWILLVPMIVVYLFNYPLITYFVSRFAQSILSEVIPLNQMSLNTGEFIPYFGGVTYLSLPTANHRIDLTITTLFVALLLLWFVMSGRRKGHPISIFVAIGALVQVVSCIFFIFAHQVFPYSASTYSELYIIQQVSLWLFFMIIMGVVSALLGNGRILFNLAFLFGVLSYSFVYGVLRYITYLYVLSSVSAIYMAALFFTFGPLFDFLYITYFYAHYVDKFIVDNEKKRTEEIWQW